MKQLLAILGCVLLSSAPAVRAAPQTLTYDLEVLVFENRLPTLEGGELWTKAQNRALPDFKNTAAPGETSTPATLSAAATALERDGNYRVLVHKRWRQTVDEKTIAKAVRLQTTDEQLDGVLRFYLSRFLHVDVDLTLKDKTDASGELSYRLTQQRRVKTQDLNYFDHPKFGVLFKAVQVGK